MQQYRTGGFNILPLVVKNLLILNGILFLAKYILASKDIDLTQYLGLHYFSSQYFMPHQFVSYMFMHGTEWHIIFNMLALWMFGGVLENYWGAKRFLIFYMITALGAAGAHLGYTTYKLYPAHSFHQTQDPDDFIDLIERNKRSYMQPDSFAYRLKSLAEASRNAPELKAELSTVVSEIEKDIADVPVVGASGAIYGILMAFGMLFPNSVLYLYFLIPMKAKYFVMLFGSVELIFGFMELPGDNFAHFAHLGGMIFGFFLVKYWSKTRKTFY